MLDKRMSQYQSIINSCLLGYTLEPKAEFFDSGNNRDQSCLPCHAKYVFCSPIYIYTIRKTIPNAKLKYYSNWDLEESHS